MGTVDLAEPHTRQLGRPHLHLGRHTLPIYRYLWLKEEYRYHATHVMAGGQHAWCWYPGHEVTEILRSRAPSYYYRDAQQDGQLLCPLTSA